MPVVSAKLGKRALAVLREIAEYKAGYSKEWCKATCAKLVELGLIQSCGPFHWRATVCGIDLLVDIEMQKS